MFNFDKSLEESGLGHIKATLGGFGYGGLRTKCSTLEGKRYCQSYNSYWKLTTSMVDNSKEVSLNLHGLAFANVTDKVMYIYYISQTH